MGKKNDVFVEHIKSHLRQMYKDDKIPRKVCCKICGMSIDEIYDRQK